MRHSPNAEQGRFSFFNSLDRCYFRLVHLILFIFMSPSCSNVPVVVFVRSFMALEAESCGGDDCLFLRRLPAVIFLRWVCAFL